LGHHVLGVLTSQSCIHPTYYAPKLNNVWTKCVLGDEINAREHMMESVTKVLTVRPSLTKDFFKLGFRLS